MVYKQPKSKYWWFKFTWNGTLVRKSTKQTNKRVAEQMEAAYRTALAKGEVGITQREASPTLDQFARNSFFTFLDATKAEEPNTISFYKACAENLLHWPKLAKAKLEHIKGELITAYISHRQSDGLSVATINRELATLRRMLRLAAEWGNLSGPVPKIRLLDGESGRERVLSVDEEASYLSSAELLVRTVVTVMLDCGLRPEEVYRLRWNENYSDNRIVVHRGKTKAARRSISVTPRVAALLDIRTAGRTGEWIFPAATKSGHIEQSSIKKQHLAAIRKSEITPFVVYDARHTCLTRWAKWMDPFTLKKLAGHESLSTTMRYIHLNERDSDYKLTEARRKHAEESAGRPGDRDGHTSGHTELIGAGMDQAHPDVNHSNDETFWCARRGSNSRPIDSKSIALSN